MSRMPIQQEEHEKHRGGENLLLGGTYPLFNITIICSSFLRLLAAIPFTSMSSSAKVAPRIEIYTVLACATHRPDIGSQGLLSIFPASTGLHSFKEWPESAGLFNASTCASDPVVQAAVAKLIAGLILFFLDVSSIFPIAL